MNDHINDFLHYLLVEKRSADNTIQSYRRDLNSYIRFLEEKEKIEKLKRLQRAHILHFLSQFKDEANHRGQSRGISHPSGLFTIFYSGIK